MRPLSWLVAVCLLSSSAAAQIAQEESVPFTLVQNIIVVEGSLNGNPATWVVDTGSNQTCVTPLAARTAGLGLGQAPFCKSIAVGQAVAKDFRVVVDDPKAAHFLRLAGLNYHGILGTTFLERFQVTLDYPNSRVIFRPPDSAPEEGATVPFELKRRLIFVDASLDGRPPVKFIFDCGAQAILLRPRTAARLGIDGAPRSLQRPDVRWTRVDSFKLGETAVGPLDVAIRELEQAAEADPDETEFAGLVGYNFLSRFRVTIDYQKSLIRLAEPDRRRPERPPARPVRKPEVEPPPEPPRPPLGLDLMETRVQGVDKGSPAEKAGFRTGDVILAVDGQEVRFVEEIRAIVTGVKPGGTITFSIRRKKEKLSITLTW